MVNCQFRKCFEALWTLPLRSKQLYISHALPSSWELTGYFPDVCPRTFDLVHNHLTKLAYAGPVGLSCDDTKLSPALQPYWDRDAECYFILGGTGDPVQVLDVESFRELIEEAGVDKATKVCKLHEACTQSINIRIAPPLVSTNSVSQNPPNHRRWEGHFREEHRRGVARSPQSYCGRPSGKGNPRHFICC